MAGSRGTADLKTVLAEDDLLRSPAWFPLRIADRGDMTLLHLDEAAYRAASFLDERLLALKCAQATCGLEFIQSAAATLKPQSHYIFHTGHVGSTLVSRLVGAHEGFFSLREPALLRTFTGNPPRTLGAAIHDPAQPDPAQREALNQGALELSVVVALLARSWRANQRTVIKATSIVNELAELILAAEYRPAAIFMFTSPLAYLRGILAGQNSRMEARVLSPARLRRLVPRLEGIDWRLDALCEGEYIAMNWLCEMTALHQAALRFESQVLWVDFDAFLIEPLSGLHAIFRALGAAPSEREIESIVTGPLMHQYSKAPEHAYDAALRREVLQSADWEHAVEIRRGMDWLGSAAMRDPVARAVLEYSARLRHPP
jgi:hypothetical protein